jgi:hypothetical protein
MSFGFTDAWAQAVKDVDLEGQDWDPDEGDYTVRVMKAKTDITNTGTELVKLRLRIIGGEHAGDGFDHVMTFGSEFAMKMTVVALRGYGLDIGKVTSFEDLDHELGALAGTEADVTVKRPNGYLNVYVNSARPGERPPPGEADPDDLPF